MYSCCFSRLVGCIFNELFNCCLFFHVVVIDIAFIITTFYALFCTSFFILICTQINLNEIRVKVAFFPVQTHNSLAAIKDNQLLLQLMNCVWICVRERKRVSVHKVIICHIAASVQI